MDYLIEYIDAAEDRRVIVSNSSLLGRDCERIHINGDTVVSVKQARRSIEIEYTPAVAVFPEEDYRREFVNVAVCPDGIDPETLDVDEQVFFWLSENEARMLDANKSPLNEGDFELWCINGWKKTTAVQSLV